jgi:hypothetical protein
MDRGLDVNDTDQVRPFRAAGWQVLVMANVPDVPGRDRIAAAVMAGGLWAGVEDDAVEQMWRWWSLLGRLVRLRYVHVIGVQWSPAGRRNRGPLRVSAHVVQLGVVSLPMENRWMSSSFGSVVGLFE